MTIPDRCQSVCVPPSPPGTTRSGWLASVCSPAAPRLSLVPLARLFSAARGAYAVPNPCARSCAVTFSLAPTIGSAPQTR
jgi:hypothetical protein